MAGSVGCRVRLMGVGGGVGSGVEVVSAMLWVEYGKVVIGERRL